MKESQIRLPKGKGAGAHGIRNKDVGQSEVWGEWERSLGKFTGDHGGSSWVEK